MMLHLTCRQSSTFDVPPLFLVLGSEVVLEILVILRVNGLWRGEQAHPNIIAVLQKKMSGWWVWFLSGGMRRWLTSLPFDFMNSISSEVKLAIDMDLTRCGGVSPLLHQSNISRLALISRDAWHYSLQFSWTGDADKGTNGRVDICWPTLVAIKALFVRREGEQIS